MGNLDHIYSMKAKPRARRRGWKPYEVEQKAGHVRIDKVVKDGVYQTDVAYQVTTLCCGTTMVRTHRQLLGSVSRGVLMCDTCRKAFEKQRVKDRQEKTRALYAPVAVEIYAAGMYWRPLGRLGMRAGAIDSERPG